MPLPPVPWRNCGHRWRVGVFDQSRRTQRNKAVTLTQDYCGGVIFSILSFLKYLSCKPWLDSPCYLSQTLMATYNMDKESGILLKVLQLPDLQCPEAHCLSTHEAVSMLTPDCQSSSVIAFNPQVSYTNKKCMVCINIHIHIHTLCVISSFL